MIQGKSKKELTRSIGFSTHCPNPNQLPSLQLDLHRFPLRFPFGEKDGDNQAPFEATEYLDFRPYCGHLSLLLLQRSSVNLEVTRVTYQVHLTYHSCFVKLGVICLIIITDTKRKLINPPWLSVLPLFCFNHVDEQQSSGNLRSWTKGGNSSAVYTSEHLGSHYLIKFANLS